MVRSTPKRLALLKELSLAANPRFGVDRTIELMLRRVLSFYDGDYCVLLLGVDDNLHLYRIKQQDPDGACRAARLDGQMQIPQIPMSAPYVEVYKPRAE